MVDFTKLSAPLDPAEVEWRVGSTNKDKSRGMALAYIDARAVMDRLDEVCGPDGWQCRYSHATGKTVCDIGIRCGDEWVWKADGAGDTDVEAEKGALSAAFKRAAVRWGIGRYLYEIASPWVALKEHGRSYIIDPAEHTRLRKMLPGSRIEAENAPAAAPTTNSHTNGHAYQPPRFTVDVDEKGAPNWFAWAAALDKEVQTVETLSGLEALWKANAAALKNAEKNAPDWFANLVRSFGDRKNVIRSEHP